MKVLSKLVLLVFVMFSLSACMGNKNMDKSVKKEDASFMLMKKNNKNSHYYWMMSKK